MNALGYTWRANAACLCSTLDPHADFIYEGGNASGHGVVLAEAHGSFAANASAQSVHLQSKNKYLRQGEALSCRDLALRQGDPRIFNRIRFQAQRAGRVSESVRNQNHQAKREEGGGGAVSSH
jgi:hypothetical protein